MTSVLESSMAKTIGKALSGLFLDAVLTRSTPVAGANAWEPASQLTNTYPCKAITEERSIAFLPSGTATSDYVKIIILANSLSIAPLPGDMILIRGRQYTIVHDGSLPAVSIDPAQATWTCRAQ
jgi:hypothetical protein